MTASIARVLIDSPLPQVDRLFDYAIPPALESTALAGTRVRVPWRSAGRLTDGIIIEVVARQADGFSGALSDLESVVSPVCVLTPEVWAVARKVSERAAGNANDVLRLALPSRQARVEKAYLSAISSEQRLSDVPALAAPASAGPASAAHLPAAQSPVSEPPVSEPPVSEPPVSEPPVPEPIAGYGLAVIEQVIDSSGRLAIAAIPEVCLLTRTVPEAGATWVGHWAVTMAQSAAYTLAAGKTVILAVPDYRDQEQLVAALSSLIPVTKILRMDSRQPNSERYRSFLRALSDDALVIVGNRSVVYAPATRLGLIALWDDGDPLYSEPLSPYVHTRDAALIRQEQQGCALLFFSHTRSSDVQRLVEIGWCAAVSPAPAVSPRIIPTSQQPANDGFAAYARIPETAWREARAALETGPVLVQVARPGYAPRLRCKDCRTRARCRDCEGPLEQKAATATPSCAWCGALGAGWKCASCEGSNLRLVGSGAGRTAEDLGRAFPGVRIIVADGDRPVLTVGAEPAIVIATRGAEPVAAGGYRAVLLLDGDGMIARESLRVAEDCLRWWSNAAALAQRRAPVILVGVGGALASTLATWRQPDFIRQELADRRTLRFPPAVRVATVSGDLDAVNKAVGNVASGLSIPETDILGPTDSDGGVRTIVRFNYSVGAEIAAGFKAEIIGAATRHRRPVLDKGPRRAPAPTLRVRFDDLEPFVEN